MKRYVNTADNAVEMARKVIARHDKYMKTVHKRGVLIDPDGSFYDRSMERARYGNAVEKIVWKFVTQEFAHPDAEEFERKMGEAHGKEVFVVVRRRKVDESSYSNCKEASDEGGRDV